MGMRNGRLTSSTRPIEISAFAAGNYFEQRCADGTFNCVPTVAAGLAASNVGGTVTTTKVRYVLTFLLYNPFPCNDSIAQGCDIDDLRNLTISAAVAAATSADVVVLAIGLDANSAHEGSDRINMSVPGGQNMLSAAVLAVGKPTIVLIFAGQAIGL